MSVGVLSHVPSPAVRDHCLLLRERFQEWLDWHGTTDNGLPYVATMVYADLMLVWALARVKEHDEGRVVKARSLLARRSRCHDLLWRAFQERLTQAWADLPHQGTLSPALVGEREGLERDQHYAFDRFRRHSRILEPDQRINPYGVWGDRQPPQAPGPVQNTEELRGQLNRLFSAREEERDISLRAALAFHSQCDRDETHAALPEVVRFVDDHRAFPTQVLALLTASLRAAGRVGEQEALPGLCDRARRMLRFVDADRCHEACAAMVEAVVAGLLSCERCEELDEFLGQVRQTVLAGTTVEALAQREDPQGPGRLLVLQAAAGGWMHFGWQSLVRPVLEAGLAYLQVRERWQKGAREQASRPARTARFARRYLAALGSYPADAMRCYTEAFFRRLPALTDPLTTRHEFWLTHLELFEAALFATLAASGHPCPILRDD